MQLTGGEYKGAKLITPKNTRPTLSQVREAVFNILNSYIEKEKPLFLDGYSGSGIMALEAKSRGYDVISVEINPKTVSQIKSNFNSINSNANIICTSFEKFILNTNDKFDIIYLDPPWNSDYDFSVKNSLNHLSDNGFLIIESDKKDNINFSIYEKSNIKIFKDKTYGRARITFLKHI